MHEERDDGTDQEHHKKDFGDAHGAGGNTTETEYCSNNRNYKKDDGVVQHEDIPFEVGDCSPATLHARGEAGNSPSPPTNVG
jgi:hypothetical protein